MKYYTTKEAAEYLKVSVHTIRDWYRRGVLRGSKPNGKNILFERDDLDALMQKSRSWLSKLLNAKGRTHIDSETKGNS